MSRVSSVSVLVILVALVSVGCAGSAAKNPAPAPTPVDPQAELAAARELLAADSTDVDALFRMGLAWQDIGGAPAVDSAKVTFERLLAIDPDNVQALVHYGLTLEDANKPAEALEQYQKAAEVAPDDPLPHINMGSLLYFNFQRTYEAKSALTKAIELDSDNPDAHFNLGVLFADAHMYREAQAEWERVLELSPEGPAANLARANLEKIEPLLQLQKPADSGEAPSSSP